MTKKARVDRGYAEMESMCYLSNFDELQLNTAGDVYKFCCFIETLLSGFFIVPM